MIHQLLGFLLDLRDPQTICKGFFMVDCPKVLKRTVVSRPEGAVGRDRRCVSRAVGYVE
jgi:hypothetical protein